MIILFFFNEEFTHFSLEKLISWQVMYCFGDSYKGDRISSPGCHRHRANFFFFKI